MLVAALLACSPCERPRDLGEPALQRAGSLDVRRRAPRGQEQELVHLMDLRVGPGDVLYGAGTGGLWSFDISEGEPQRLGQVTSMENMAQIAFLDDERVVALTVDGEQNGMSDQLHIIDLQDPSQLWTTVSARIDAGWSVATFQGQVLVGRSGGIDVYGHDFSQPIASVEGLGRPVRMEVADEVLWVADRDRGLVQVDPETWEAGEAWPLAGEVNSLSIQDGVAAVGLGSAGVQWVDLETGEASEAVVVGGTVNDVALDEDLLWVSALDGLSVLERSDDGVRQLGFEDTDRFTLCIAPDPLRDDAAYGCDWSSLHHLVVDPSVQAPAARLGATDLVVGPGQSQTTLVLENRGSAALQLVDVASRDEVAVDRPDSIQPGEIVELMLEFVDGFDGAAKVCVATNDPARPTQTLPVHTGDAFSELSLGIEAPDFTLPDLDGTPHSLSDYRGQPVLLVWFATW